MSVVHDPDYIVWVKHSLNRLVFAGLKSDGTVSGSYRAWVKEFQSRTGCPTKNGNVDRATQDYLIAINNVDTNKSSRAYIKWVQEALQSTGFGGSFGADGTLNAATIEAIRKFQRKANHKHADGVVGPRTERDLALRASWLTVPGYFPGGFKPKEDPIDPVKQRQDDWLKNNIDSRSMDELLESWTSLYLQDIEEDPTTILDPEARTVIVKMLRKFKSGIHTYRTSNRYDYLPEQAARSIAIGKHLGEPVSKHTKNALAEIRNGIGYYSHSGGSAARYELFKRDVYAMYIKIDNGIREIWYQMSNASGVTAGSYKDLNDWYEEKHGDPTSIISCFPGPSGGLF